MASNSFLGVAHAEAAKIMRRAEEDLTLMPPEDKSVTTLYLGGLPAGTKEKETKGSEVCWDLFMHGCLCRKVNCRCCLDERCCSNSLGEVICTCTAHCDVSFVFLGNASKKFCFGESHLRLTCKRRRHLNTCLSLRV